MTGDTGDSVNGCTGLKDHTASVCTASGLQSGITYSFAIQIVCTDSSLNSVISAKSGELTTQPNYGAPVKLNVFQQPSTTGFGNQILTNQPQIEVLDAQNIRVAISTAPIMLSIVAGTGTPGAKVVGTYTMNAKFGLAAFTDIAIDLIGSGYVLTATSAAYTSAQTNPIQIIVGAPASLVISVAPSAFNTWQTPLQTQPVIQIVDAGGNLVTTSTLQVTASIVAGTASGACTVGGTVVVTAVGGIATFTNLQVNGQGQNIQLVFNAGMLTSPSTAPVVVSMPAGTATGLAWVYWSPVTDTPANTVLSPALQVTVVDVNGIACPSASIPITVSLKPAPGSVNPVLSGTLVALSSNGVASFADLSINVAASAYVLIASATGLPSANSSPFDIVLGKASQVQIRTQPSVFNTNGYPFLTQPVVAIADSYGNTIVTSSAKVTVTLKAGLGTGGATIKGTSIVSSIQGTASFTDIYASAIGTGYVLVFSSSGLTSAESVPFGMQAANTKPTSISFLVQPAGASANVAFTTQPQVVLLDSYGNVVVSDSVVYVVQLTLKSNTGAAGAVLKGTVSLAQQSGVASFSGLSIGLLGKGYQLVASVVGSTLTPVSSSAFDVVVGAASQIVFTATPSNEVYGVEFVTQPSVQIADAAGNAVTGYSVSNLKVSLAIKTGTGQYRAALSGTVSGSTTPSSKGTVTFAGISMTGFSSMTDYVLQATSVATLYDPVTTKNITKVLTGYSPVFTVFTLADKNKSTFTEGQQIAADSTNSVSSITSNPSLFGPAVGVIVVIILGMFFLAYKMGYICKSSKTDLEKKAEKLTLLNNQKDDPFSFGVGNILADSSKGPAAVLSLEGIESGDLDSIPLSSISGLEGIGGDLTLADVAELSLDEIESIMNNLMANNDEWSNVESTTVDLQSVVNDNPYATSMSQVKENYDAAAASGGHGLADFDAAQGVDILDMKVSQLMLEEVVSSNVSESAEQSVHKMQ
jgi:hypothetical protein